MNLNGVRPGVVDLKFVVEAWEVHMKFSEIGVWFMHTKDFSGLVGLSWKVTLGGSGECLQ